MTERSIQITEKQWGVIEALSNGNVVKEAASKLGVSVNAVQRRMESAKSAGDFKTSYEMFYKIGFAQGKNEKCGDK